MAFLLRAAEPGVCLGHRDTALTQTKDKKSDYVQTLIIHCQAAAEPSEGEKPSRLIPEVKSLLALGPALLEQ